MNTAVGMNAALSLDATGVKWPFAPQRRPVVQRPSPRATGATSADAGHGIAPASQGQHAGPSTADHATTKSDLPSLVASQNLPRAMQPAGVAGLGGHSAGQWQSLPAAARVGTSATAQVSRRQMIGDVALVAVWAAMIPGMLWLGHAAGF
ncbi:MAG: hypothetical protein WC590_12975 [Burkholderiaceae bacterium]